MNRHHTHILMLLSALGLLPFTNSTPAQTTWENRTGIVELPPPHSDGRMSLEKTLSDRRSVRNFRADDSLTLEDVSQLLWAGQGVTSSGQLRTAPSAGARYPLEVFVVAGNVKRLTAGVYHYDPHRHELKNVERGDRRKELSLAAFDQHSVRDAGAVIIFSAVYDRTTLKYGERGRRYVYMEAGHAAQNVCLQAVALNLGTVTVGAFRDEEVKNILQMTDGQEPLYMLPVGNKGE